MIWSLDGVIDALRDDLLLHQFILALVGAAGDDRLGADVADALERLQIRQARRIDVEQGRLGGAWPPRGPARVWRARSWRRARLGRGLCAKAGAARAKRAAAAKARKIFFMAISLPVRAVSGDKTTRRPRSFNIRRPPSTFDRAKRKFSRSRACPRGMRPVWSAPNIRRVGHWGVAKR